jgi:hypothetical protein
MNKNPQTAGLIDCTVGVIVTAERGTVAADAAAVGDTVSLDGWDG